MLNVRSRIGHNSSRVRMVTQCSYIIVLLSQSVLIGVTLCYLYLYINRRTTLLPPHLSPSSTFSSDSHFPITPFYLGVYHLYKIIIMKIRTLPSLPFSLGVLFLSSSQTQITFFNLALKQYLVRVQELALLLNTLEQLHTTQRL